MNVCFLSVKIKKNHQIFHNACPVQWFLSLFNGFCHCLMIFVIKQWFLSLFNDFCNCLRMMIVSAVSRNIQSSSKMKIMMAMMMMMIKYWWWWSKTDNENDDDDQRLTVKMMMTMKDWWWKWWWWCWRFPGTLIRACCKKLGLVVCGAAENTRKSWDDDDYLWIMIMDNGKSVRMMMSYKKI